MPERLAVDRWNQDGNPIPDTGPCTAVLGFPGMQTVFDCDGREEHRGRHHFDDVDFDGNRFTITWEANG